MRAVNSGTDDLFGVFDTFPDFGGDYGYRFIIKLILILCIQRHCLSECSVFVHALYGIARPHGTDVLINLIFDIKLFENEESFATLLADKTNADILKEKKHIEGELQKCIVRSEQVAELCIRCYEDNVAGKLSDEMFMRFSQKYEIERLELKEKIRAYRRRLAEVEEMQLGKEKFIAAVRKFMQMDKLTAPLLQELINRIDVYEVTGTGKNRKQMIKIHYKFVGYLELPSLARQHNYREEARKGVAVEYVPNALPA